MSFVRVNPFSWAVGDKLTSAQQNALDIDHANALDKTIAGDTIAGTVQITGTAQIIAFNANGIVAGVNGAIASTLPGGITSTTPGGISLTGGVTDWVTLSPPRTRSLFLPASPFIGTLATGWTIQSPIAQNAPALVGPGPANATSVQPIFIPTTHNGATLSSVQMWLVVATAHGGGTPNPMPQFSVNRIQMVANGAGSSVPLNPATNVAFPTPGSGAAWFNSGLLQSWTYTCNQNNLIDNTQYLYFISLKDESGSNSAAGNLYYGYTLNYTAINNSQFSI